MQAYANLSGSLAPAPEDENHSQGISSESNLLLHFFGSTGTVPYLWMDIKHFHASLSLAYVGSAKWLLTSLMLTILTNYLEY